MEKWEYASGYEMPSGEFVNNDHPTTYEQARSDLETLIRDFSDADWLINPCVVKRSARHLDWQPVKDHAAELLAELLGDMADNFGRLGKGIVQGNDIKAICTHIARGLGTETAQEFDN